MYFFSFIICCVTDYEIHFDDIYEVVFSKSVLHRFSYIGIKAVQEILNGVNQLTPMTSPYKSYLLFPYKVQISNQLMCSFLQGSYCIFNDLLRYLTFSTFSQNEVIQIAYCQRAYYSKYQSIVTFICSEIKNNGRVDRSHGRFSANV